MLDWVKTKLKLAHHSHTGRVLPREHTSHGVLVVLCVLAGVMLVFATRSLMASADPIVGQGDLTLTGRVPIFPPHERAVILTPQNGQTFTKLPIILSGTCQAGDYVQFYRNSKALGAAACPHGKFGTNIDLVPGKNRLVVRTLDYVFQFGPDSLPVIVYYNPPPPPPTPPVLTIGTDSPPFGVTINQPYSLKLIIEGGKAPYAVNVQWGDGRQDIISRSNAGEFTLTHAYKKSDIYTIQINASDSEGARAQAQTDLLVGGPVVFKHDFFGSEARSVIELVWPIYLIVLAVISSFWLGERYQLDRLRWTKDVKKRSKIRNR